MRVEDAAAAADDAPLDSKPCPSTSAGAAAAEAVEIGGGGANDPNSEELEEGAAPAPADMLPVTDAAPAAPAPP